MADGSAAQQTEHGWLDEGEVRLLVAVAEAVTPEGAHVRAPSREIVAAVEDALTRTGRAALVGYGPLLRALDLAAVPLAGARLSELPVEARARVLQALSDRRATHLLVRGVTVPIKLAQVLRVAHPEALGVEPHVVGLPVVEEAPRWRERIVDARTLPDGETIEVDAVVVGSGAGGAPVAHALATRGHAVLVLEDGGYHGRRDFRGRAWSRGLALQKQRFLVGNALIALPTGETVGGSTTINSGTCLRTPPDVLRRWRFEHGLVDLDPATMEPFFEKVEAMLGVAPTPGPLLGGCARVVARGADALGWSHGPLPRNAPGCDGQGYCCFGCPSDAKRSTNVSYIPAALRAGAMLYHHARVEEVLVAGGRAVGVVARARGGDGPRIRVLARTVVLSCGTVGTPALLLRQGLANGSGQLGRNLTVHPASNAWAEYDEAIEGWKAVPQSYGVDEFTREGLRFEGAFAPLDVIAPTLPLLGRAWTDFVDAFPRMACFGFLVAERSRGRVALGPGGGPLLLYHLEDADRRALLRGHALVSRLLLAGGAKRVLPGILGWPDVRSEHDIARLEREGPRDVPAHRLDLAAFHPLGTCRMGADPSRSVVGPTHEAHDLGHLFVVDGSAVNGPLCVNPQVTIMALAERAAGFVERRIEAASRASKPRPRAITGVPAVEFTETMAGRCALLADGREVDARFTVRAGAPDAAALARGLATPEGAVLVLEGTATVVGLATSAPCVGALAIRPLARTGTLVYDLDFEGDDGAAYHLHGEKSVALTAALSGMTTLATEVARRADGVPVARGTLRFALRDVLPWLATWRLRRATTG